MAINLLKAKKKERYMLIILVVIILAIIFTVWFGFFREKGTVSINVFPQEAIHQTVNIDWSLLESSELEELKGFENTVPFEDEVGKKNPFVPY